MGDDENSERERSEMQAGGTVEPPEVWRLEQPEPTTLIALWPVAQRPTMTEILAAIVHHCDGKAQMVHQLETEDERVLWNMVVRVPALPAPLVVWSEPSRPIPPEEFETDELRQTASRAQWVVGLETLLHPSDPLSDYTVLMRLVADALADVPAVLDVNTQQWHARELLAERFGSPDAQPPSLMLWVIHQVGPEDEGDPGASEVDDNSRSRHGVNESKSRADEDEVSSQSENGIWLHTHGLWRCGRPELEMIGVPAVHASAASLLINAMAEMMLEMALPAPGEPFEIGAGLRVVVQPWGEIVETLDESVAGSMHDRGGELEMMHTGVRAVVCGEQPRADARTDAGLDTDGEARWTWPREIVDRLERDDATLYGTTRATERQSKLARATWPELAMAFACLPRPTLAGDEPPALFVIKAGFADENRPEAGREHLWFRAMRFSGDRAECQLLNRPLIMTHMEQGSSVWIDRTAVSDWSVLTDNGQFGPSDAAAMQRAIDVLAANAKGQRP